MIKPPMRSGLLLHRIANNAIAAILVIGLCQQSTMTLSTLTDQIRVYTRSLEFDYVTWTLDALGLKSGTAILGLPKFISAPDSKNLVLQYASDIRQKQQLTATLLQIYSDPNLANPEDTAENYKQQLAEINAELERIAPTAEAVLQQQTSAVIAELGFSAGGQVLPPVSFHATPLPYALIVSPLNVIRQDANISLTTDLTVNQMIDLEKKVSTNLDVSALVEEVGGIGTYPTMVQQTSDLNWLTEVIAHEWTHNYLTFRPLGMNYDASPELRTMNETTASIAGKEIGALVIEKYYPEMVPPETNASPTPPEEPERLQPAFDFRAVMHETRLHVDQLLAMGKIDEAEQYMESQREFIWQNGYQIRKLNQAYFAFHGAYADTLGGAAGTDPVGPAVRELRADSPSLAAFIHRISWMSSYDQLAGAVQNAAPQ